MEMEVLNRDWFASGNVIDEPTVRVTYQGVVYFNHHAVRVLNLLEKGKKGYFPVLFMRDTKIKYNFGVFRDASGYVLRKGSSGGALFNFAGLARHIIDSTWDRPGAIHGVGCDKPKSMVFRVAEKPLDDDKNKDVFALLRRKE